MALHRINGRRVSVGRFGAGESLHLAASVTSTNNVPSAMVRRQAYTPGGMSRLTSPGHHPYWRGGNVAHAWANEDDPETKALFYTARDLYQTDDGRVFYDGDDDIAAVGAFGFLRKLFSRGQAPGIHQPTELRRGTGGVHATPLAPKLGIHQRWKTHELAPGLQVRLREGTKVAIANTGTVDAPIWQISMGVRNPATGTFDGSGVVPLLALALKGGAAAAGGRAARQAQAKAARGESLDDPAQRVTLAPGQQVQIGALDGVGSMLEGAEAGGVCDDVQVGALMIDSDGRQIEI